MSIFVVSGASGAGKTTIAHKIRDKGIWGEIISHTSRPMREGEVEGETYYYTSKEQFLEMLNRGEFVEYITYDGNHYGISKKEIRNKLKEYKHVYIVAEYGGYKQIKAIYPKAVGIFIYATRISCLNNMINRGDKMTSVNKRMELYNSEIANMNHYDFAVFNHFGSMDKTVSDIESIINKGDLK